MTRLRLLALAGIASLAAACGSSSDPAPGACTYTYSAWGTCQAGGTQSRTVVTATPDGCTGTPELTQSCQPAVSIAFKALVGDQPFDCAHAAGYAVGTGAIPWIPKDFRFYVSNVRLVTAGGVEAPVTLDASYWQNYGVALLDFEDGAGTCNVGTLETNTAIAGTAAAGTYTRIRFDLGVPVASNHLNVQAAEPPLSISPMYWSWTGGYKHAKIEGTIQRAAAPAAPFTFNFHLGSTGCTVATPGDFSTTVCTKLNTPAIDLPFDAASQAVALDVAELLAAVNMDPADGGGAPGCMSGETDPECLPIFPLLGLDINGTAAQAQTVFRAVAK